jgi:hypothetical protein
MTDVTPAQSALIVQFATGRTGQQVGDGECFALADQALRSAPARSAANYGAITATADYRWGRLIQRTDARAGDIIQFRNFTFVETTTTRVTQADGSFTQNTQVRNGSRGQPNHTAMVAEVGADGAITVYEQNVAGNRTVHSNRVFCAALPATTQTTTESGVTTMVTRSVAVHGAVRFYRPEQ